MYKYHRLLTALYITKKQGIIYTKKSKTYFHSGPCEITYIIQEDVVII